MYEEENNLENEESVSEDNGLDQSSASDSEPVQSSQSPSGGVVSNAQKVGSYFQKIWSLWKKLPPPVQGAILTALGYLLLIVVVIVLIFLLAGAATGVGEELWNGLHGTAENVDTFFEQVGNFFTGQGFVTNEEEATKQEQQYYQKLQDVYEKYQEELGVDIDTTLITATLFYGKGMSDYIDDKDIYSQDNSNDDDIFQETASFYRVAKRHIKTLAKFQIVEERSYNTCYSEKFQTIAPESDKKIADTWTGFFGYNTRATFNYQLYQSISYPDADGNARNITWCEYENAEPQLKDYYQQDKELYEHYKLIYNNCVSREKALCRSHCYSSYVNDAGELVTDTDYDCLDECNNKSYCPTEKAKADEVKATYEANWITDGPFDANGNFICTYSNNWGNLNPYTGRGFKNYNFNKEWVKNQSSVSDTMAGITTPISCSAKPSITYYYRTSLEREGVYYHKLLSRSAQFLSNKNFIEKYYPDQVDSIDLLQAEKDAEEIVEGIYDMYEYIADRSEYCLYVAGSSQSYMSESRAEFIAMIANDVVQDMQNTGVLASVTIAQAAHESANGKSTLSSQFNNYYGMTAGGCANNVPKSTKGTLVRAGTNGNNCSGNQYWNGDVVYMCNSSGADCQYYRVYDGFANSTADHSRLLINNNYNCQNISDPHSMLQCVQAGGYATDPEYITKVMGTINAYNLTQYDIGAISNEATVIANDINNVTASSSTNLNGWLFVGDSYTDYIRGGGESWTKNYASQEGFNVFAQAGDTTKQVYEHLSSGSNDRGDSLPSSAKGIVVLAGINDILKEGRSGYDSTGLYDVSSQSVTGTGYMKQIIEFLQSKYPNVPIYIQKVFPIGTSALGGNDENSGNGNRYWRGTLTNVNTLNALYASLASNYSNVSIIDTRSGFLDQANDGMDSSKSIDNVHISPDYYSQWLSNIKSSLGISGTLSSGVSTNAYCVSYYSSVGSGTIPGNGAQGIRMSLDISEREPYWGASNTYYSRNEGQCTWYAFGRGLEILTKNGMSMQEAITKLDATHGHAQHWFANNKHFSSSTNISQPKIGAIIVWGNSRSGHVAVVEDIEYDSNGNPAVVHYSEGNAGTSNYGGFRYASKTIAAMQTNKGGGGTYQFLGYIYLLS